jgi:hypothetical protein
MSRLLSLVNFEKMLGGSVVKLFDGVLPHVDVVGPRVIVPSAEFLSKTVDRRLESRLPDRVLGRSQAIGRAANATKACG